MVFSHTQFEATMMMKHGHKNKILKHYDERRRRQRRQRQRRCENILKDTQHKIRATTSSTRYAQLRYRALCISSIRASERSSCTSAVHSHQSIYLLLMLSLYGCIWMLSVRFEANLCRERRPNRHYIVSTSF